MWCTRTHRWTRTGMWRSLISGLPGSSRKTPPWLDVAHPHGQVHNTPHTQKQKQKQKRTFVCVTMLPYADWHRISLSLSLSLSCTLCATLDLQRQRFSVEKSTPSQRMCTALGSSCGRYRRLKQRAQLRVSIIYDGDTTQEGNLTRIDVPCVCVCGMGVCGV